MIPFVHLIFLFVLPPAKEPSLSFQDYVTSIKRHCDANHITHASRMSTFAQMQTGMKEAPEMVETKCHECSDRSCATAILDTNELDTIFRNRYVSEVRKGTNILNEGSPTSNIIYLRSGFVKEYILHPDNHELILQVIRPHSYLGLSSFFGDKINHCSYEALTDLRLCYIDIDVFTELVRSNGNFAFEILTSVERENLLFFHRYLNQSHKKIYGRVADVLLYFSKIIFADKSFQIPLTRKEIAEMAGTSRESAGRVLAKFAGDGIITLTGRNIVILKMVNLENISQYG